MPHHSGLAAVTGGARSVRTLRAMTAPTPRPLDPVTLDAGGAHVAIVPALGGKISSLRLGGREWLWTRDTLPRVAPTASAADDGASAVITADRGGYDECLPTVTACTVQVPGAGSIALPEHGELWTQTAATERVAAPAGAAAAVTRWTGQRLPYAFRRTITVGADGTVRMDYALESRGAVPMPLLWSAHPVLPFPPDTRLDLPIAARVRVWAEHGVALGGARAEHRWPVLRVGDAQATRFGPREVDFTFPALAPQRFGDAGQADYACTLVLDLPRTPGKPVRLAVEQDGARLEVEVDPGEVPHVGLWLDHGGPTPGAGQSAPHHLVLAPCLGAPDALDAAKGALEGAWEGAQWLAPGETRRWRLTWRGRAAPVSV